MTHAVGQQRAGVVQLDGLVGGVVGEIAGLVRVALQVEEQWRERAEMHVLVAIVADHIETAGVGWQSKRPLG